MAPIFKDGIRARKVYFVEDHANGCTTVMTEALYTVCRGVDNGTLDLEKEWRSWIERMLTWLQLLLYLLPTTLTYCMFHDNLLNVLWFIYFIYFKSNNSSSEDIRGDKNNKKKLHVDRDINSATQQQHRRTSKEQNGTSEQSTGSPHLQTYFLFRQVLISPQYLPKKKHSKSGQCGAYAWLFERLPENPAGQRGRWLAEDVPPCLGVGSKTFWRHVPQQWKAI